MPTAGSAITLGAEGEESELQAREIDGNSLTYLIVEPDEFDSNEEYPTVVLLHGFGAGMTDLAGLAPAIERSGYLYLFPNAPIPMQFGLGATGYAWTPPGSSGDDGAATRAEELLSGFFDEVEERHGIAEGGIVMGGFSQGGMMTYQFGLPRPEMFAGLVVLSSRVSSPGLLSERLPEHRDIPLFVAHGRQDSMIGVADARTSRDYLLKEGYDLKYYEYPMGHEINQSVMADLVPWLHDVMPPVQRR